MLLMALGLVLWARFTSHIFIMLRKGPKTFGCRNLPILKEMLVQLGETIFIF